LTHWGNYQGQPITSFSYTTICRKVKDLVIARSDLERTHTEDALVLWLPRSPEDYVKTWGDSDYVICSHTEGTLTKFFYLNAPKLLSYLKEALHAVDWEGNKIPRSMVHIEMLRLDGLLKLGIVEMIDTWDAKSGYVTIIENNSPFETPPHFRGPFKPGTCLTINLWKNATETTTYWNSFRLMSHNQDRSKKVVITAVDTGKSHQYDSLTKAAKNLSQLGKKVTVAQISNCLKGKAKTFKTGRGKCTATLL